MGFRIYVLTVLGHMGFKLCCLRGSGSGAYMVSGSRSLGHWVIMGLGV